MTTKQAKKLYRQANKGPKLSKAEQRRIELMEQDRIRKEFEKERNQARARTARERKKAKEDKEKEEKKKKGLPLFAVHPSQDTISRFVSRVDSAKQSGLSAANPLLEAVRQDAGTATEIESGADTGEEDEGDCDNYDVSDKENQRPANNSEEGREAKRPRLSQSGPKKSERTQYIVHQRPAGAVTKTSREIESEPNSRASSVDVADPVNKNRPEDRPIADTVLTSSRKEIKSGSTDGVMKCNAPVELVSLRAPPPPAVSTVSKTSPQVRVLPPGLQKHRDTGSSVRKDPQKCQIQPQSHAGPNHCGVPSKNPDVSIGHQRRLINSPAGQMPPPPPKFKTPTNPSNHFSGRSKFLPKHFPTPQQRPPAREQDSAKQSGVHSTNVLPSSTQLFLLNHLDDFFPTPSQEASELFGDDGLKDDANVPTRASISLETPSIPCSEVNRGHKAARPSKTPSETMSKSQLPPPATEGPFDFPFLSTQDFVFSSQDIRDIETPSKTRRSPTAQDQQQLAAGCSVTAGSDQKHTPMHHSRDIYGYHRLPGSSPRKRLPMQGRHKSEGSLTGPVNCHLRSSLPKSSTGQVRVNAQPGGKPAARAQTPGVTPVTSPPKKRMFGSNGPGAEVLVAMERSYQQSRREERAREEERRAQMRAMQINVGKVEQLPRNLVDPGKDGLLKAKLDLNVEKGSGEVTNNVGQTHFQDTNGKIELAASQETDYGDLDIAAEDLACLEDTI